LTGEDGNEHGQVMRAALQLAAGFAIIAALLALHALAFYLIWWVVMKAVASIPMIGRRHRHRDWERLNRSQ
jgi:hypothetical protein